MSVKVAKVTSATVMPRERRICTLTTKTPSTRRHHEESTLVFLFLLRAFFVFFVASWLGRDLEQQASQRRHGEAQRVLETVRRRRLRCDAPLIADVAAAIDRRVAVHPLGVVSRHRHADAI